MTSLADITNAIERNEPLSSILRTCLLYGHEIGSAELTSWARAELDGYRGTGAPDYRTVAVPLLYDFVTPTHRVLAAPYIHHQMKAQDEAKEAGLDDRYTFLSGIGEVEAAAAQATERGFVDIAVPRFGELGAVTSQLFGDGRTVLKIYWRVGSVPLQGLLDQVRTKTAEIVAVARQLESGAASEGTIDATDRAVQTVIGDSNTFYGDVTIAQGSGSKAASGGTVRNAPTPWYKTVVRAAIGIASFVGGVVGVAWLIAELMSK